MRGRSVLGGVCFTTEGTASPLCALLNGKRTRIGLQGLINSEIVP